MANMSYCRFENTLRDLMDCYNAMQDADDLSESERRAMKKMVEVCGDIASEYGDQDDED